MNKAKRTKEEAENRPFEIVTMTVWIKGLTPLVIPPTMRWGKLAAQQRKAHKEWEREHLSR